MSTIGIIIAFLLIFAAGTGVARLLTGRKEGLNFGELLGLGWLLGCGYVSLTIWLLGILVSGWLLTLFVVIGAICLSLAGWRTRSMERGGPWRLYDWVLLAAVGAVILYAAWWAPQLRLGWDGLAIWEAKARIAFSSGGTLPLEYFRDESRAFSHPYYPLLLPLTEAWLYSCLGEADQSAVRWIGPMFLAASCALLAGCVQRLAGPRCLALFGAASLFFVPYIFSGGWGLFAGYADFPLAVFLLAAVAAAVRWAETGSPAALRLLAVVAGLLPWVKREGKFLWLAVILVPLLLLIVRRRWRDAALMLTPGLVIIAAWFSFLAYVNVVADSAFAPVSIAAASERMDRLATLFTVFSRELLLTANWSLLWPLAGASVFSLLLARCFTVAAVFVASIGLPLCADLAAFLFTAHDYRWHVALSIQRLVLQLAPTALLALILACPWQRKPAA